GAGILDEIEETAPPTGPGGSGHVAPPGGRAGIPVDDSSRLQRLRDVPRRPVGWIARDRVRTSTRRSASSNALRSQSRRRRRRAELDGGVLVGRGQDARL